MKIFLDTNFIMDFLVRGPEYSKPAKEVLETANRFDIEFCVSFLTVANFAYILRKEPKNKLNKYIKIIDDLFIILSNDKTHLLNSLDLSAADYEDAIQFSTAKDNKCDLIITRNKKDYKFSDIPIFSPQEFIDEVKMNY